MEGLSVTSCRRPSKHGTVCLTCCGLFSFFAAKTDYNGARKGLWCMSHSHIRVPRPAPQRDPWLEFVVAASIVVLVALLAFGGFVGRSFDETNVTATGSILETRIVVDHILDSQYGGRIFYRIEARTSYEFQGQSQDRWLTASEITTARELLQAKLASRPKYCVVYWVPGHSENAKCRLSGATE